MTQRNGKKDRKLHIHDAKFCPIALLKPEESLTQLSTYKQAHAKVVVTYFISFLYKQKNQYQVCQTMNLCTDIMDNGLLMKLNDESRNSDKFITTDCVSINAKYHQMAVISSGT